MCSNLKYAIIVLGILLTNVFFNLAFAVQSIPSFSVAFSADLAANPHQQANRNSAQKTTASAAVPIQIAGQPTIVGKSHMSYNLYSYGSSDQ